MYQWYGKSVVCYAYLCDVVCSGDLGNSSWFTRCWTLQELLAPRKLVFFNCEWALLGSRTAFLGEISSASQIPKHAVDDYFIYQFSVAEKMSWAAQRSATRIEDEAYSLLGLFEINMPLIYGEGSRAFQRLQQEILRTLGDLTVLAWSNLLYASSLNDPYETLESWEPGRIFKTPRLYKESQPLDENVTSQEYLPMPITHFANDLDSDGIFLSSRGIIISLYLIPYAQDVYMAIVGTLAEVIKVEGQSEVEVRQTPRCILLHRTRLDGRFRRVTVGSRSIFTTSQPLLPCAEFRRVTLRTDVLWQAEEMPALSHPFYGMVLDSLLPTGDYTEDDVLLISSAESDTNVRCLSMPVGTYGNTGLIVIKGFKLFKGASRPVIVHLGFDFDFNPFCLVMCPEHLKDKIQNTKISVPAVDMWSFEVGDNDSIIELVKRLREAGPEFVGGASDVKELHIGSWKLETNCFEVDSVGTVTVEAGQNFRRMATVSVVQIVARPSRQEESIARKRWSVSWPSRSMSRRTYHKRLWSEIKDEPE